MSSGANSGRPRNARRRRLDETTSVVRSCGVILNAMAGNGQLDRIERLGRIISAFGVPLMLLVFVGWYAGWVPSPLLRTAESIAKTLESHDGRVGEVIQRRAVADKDLAEAFKMFGEQLRRQTNVLKLSVCANLRDPDVRAACLRE